jgi:hypothetical protein
MSLFICLLTVDIFEGCQIVVMLNIFHCKSLSILFSLQGDLKWHHWLKTVWMLLRILMFYQFTFQKEGNSLLFHQENVRVYLIILQIIKM